MSIQEVSRRIILALGVALDAHAKERRLAPLVHIHMSAQQAIYWLRLSVIDEKEEPSNTIEESSPTQDSVESLRFMPPTLFGVQEHLDYLDSEFKSIVKGLEQMILECNLSPTILYNTQRAYDKIHEALFNTELAINYYGQLTTGR